MRLYLLVAVGGAVGSVLRFAVGQVLAARFGTLFPWGTFAVNVVGSFVIGAVAAWLTPRLPLAGPSWALLVPGLLGGFTTFSAFENETLGLIRAGATGRALVYVGASVVLGLAACWAGWRIAQAVAPDAWR